MWNRDNRFSTSTVPVRWEHYYEILQHTRRKIVRRELGSGGGTKPDLLIFWSYLRCDIGDDKANQRPVA